MKIVIFIYQHSQSSLSLSLSLIPNSRLDSLRIPSNPTGLMSQTIWPFNVLFCWMAGFVCWLLD